MASFQNFAMAFGVVTLFALGALGGWFLQNRKYLLKAVGKSASVLVFLLLFFLGHSVGNNPVVLSKLDVIGVWGVLFAMAAIAGSILFVILYDKYIACISKSIGKPFDVHGSMGFGSFWGSALLLTVFSLGVFVGFRQWGGLWLTDYNLSEYTLYLFMLIVGIGVGADREAWALVKKTGTKLFFMPFAIFFGSLFGVLLLVMVQNTFYVLDILPVAAGMGYYSLSSVLISEIKGEQLGTLALMANVFREILTLLLVPLLHRYFGRLSGIASAGATAMDTSLPIIVGFSGKEMVPIAIFNGLVLTILVPFAVTLLLLIGN